MFSGCLSMSDLSLVGPGHRQLKTNSTFAWPSLWAADFILLFIRGSGSVPSNVLQPPTTQKLLYSFHYPRMKCLFLFKADLFSASLTLVPLFPQACPVIMAFLQWLHLLLPHLSLGQLVNMIQLESLKKKIEYLFHFPKVIQIIFLDTFPPLFPSSF